MPEYPKSPPGAPMLELLADRTTKTKPSALPPSLPEVIRNWNEVLNSDRRRGVVPKKLPDCCMLAGTIRRTVPSLVVVAVAAPLSVIAVVSEKSLNEMMSPQGAIHWSVPSLAKDV